MMKVLFFLSLFFLLASPTWAWDFCVPNEDGVMLYYNVVDEDEGSCEVARNKDVIWNCQVLRIPETVILNRGNRDFGDPDTVYTVIGIGDHAFYSRYRPEILFDSYEPTSLFERVELPKTISYIGEGAFYGCLWVINLEFPEGNEWLRYIGESAFAWAGPTRLTLPKTLETLSPKAFDHSNLSYIEFEEDNEYLTRIPEYCFYNSALQEVKMCSSITDIAVGAFQGCTSMHTVYFGSELNTIGEYAFENCRALDSPKLPYGLGIIGECAFRQHKYWHSLELPATIIDIGEYALCGLVKKDLPNSLDIKELYVNKETTPYCVSEKSLGDYQYDYTEKKYTRVITGTNLIVPLNCKEEYATTYPWDRFDTRYITERDLSGIKPATAKTSQPEDVFSLDGRRLAKTQKGLNIIRYKDGTAKKVVAK